MKTWSVVGVRRFASSLSLSRQLDRERLVVQQLNSVIEPFTSKTLGDLGLIHGHRISESNDVFLKVNFLVPGYPHRDQVLDECRKKLVSLDWVRNVNFDVSFDVPKLNEKGSLKGVKHLIGVSSCKGGVGKSTVSVNLACSLALRGLKVGLLDADIYGPSLPQLLEPQDKMVRRSAEHEKNIYPLISKSLPNLKFISFGHVNPQSGAPGAGGKSAALMRGPMATKVLNQLMMFTEWGDLDYLIVDMPPGTGDIQITLCQSSIFSGALVVTTPHRLSLSDVSKGIEMFGTLNTPILGLVENMAYIVCPHGSKFFPFGRGGKEKIFNYLGLQEGRSENFPFHSIPLILESDEDLDGKIVEPIVIRNSSSPSGTEYSSITDSMIGSLFRNLVKDADSKVPSIHLDKTQNQLRVRYFLEQHAEEYLVPSSKLRSHSGLNTDSMITKVVMQGNYGVSVNWSDHTVIYSFETLREIARRSL